MHHLFVSHDKCAYCSCGHFEIHDEKWDFLDGYQIRERVWPDFKNRVLGENPDLVETWRVIGWYPNLRKYDRNFSNISDGGVFSSLEKAK